MGLLSKERTRDRCYYGEQKNQMICERTNVETNEVKAKIVLESKPELGSTLSMIHMEGDSEKDIEDLTRLAQKYGRVELGSVRKPSKGEF